MFDAKNEQLIYFERYLNTLNLRLLRGCTSDEDHFYRSEVQTAVSHCFKGADLSPYAFNTNDIPQHRTNSFGSTAIVSGGLVNGH